MCMPPFVYPVIPLQDDLSCFHFLAIVDNAAVNMGMQISFQHIAFLYFVYIAE